jgi:hypothetical protein
VRRTAEIAQIFREAFGSDANRIKPILGWGTWNPLGAEEMLSWYKANFNDPKQTFFAVSGAAYFSDEGTEPNASLEDLLEAMKKYSDGQRTDREAFVAIAKQYGLKFVAYEGGPDVSRSNSGTRENMTNRILVNRSPCIQPLMIRNMIQNWFELGADMYTHYTISSKYGRYGAFGLSEDIRNLDTYKWRALRAMQGGSVPDVQNCDMARGPISIQSDVAAPVDLSKATRIVRATGAVQLDGDLDAAYAGAPVVELKNSLYSSPKNNSDLAATARLVWDETNLYVHYTVTDDVQFNTAPNYYENDGTELYLDTDNKRGSRYDKNSYQFMFKYGSDAPYEQRGRTQGVQYVSKKTNGGYTLEVRVPWKVLEVVPAADLVLGFELQLNENDGLDGVNRKGKLTWWRSAGDDAWVNPSGWGTAILVDR